MASDGDTITYTTVGEQSEDVSSVDTATVTYVRGAGGGGNNGSFGGLVENVTIDVSSLNVLYIYVASQPDGRFSGEGSSFGDGGGSTEVYTAEQQGTEQTLCGAGGGYGATDGFRGVTYGGDGGRVRSDNVGEPYGGRGGDFSVSAEAYINNSSSLVSGGSTSRSAGNGTGVNGEVEISYSSSVGSPPAAPTNLVVTNEQQVTFG